MKLISYILVFLIIGCTKEVEQLKPSLHCELCVELSDKYFANDTSFIRTDTLFKRRLCDSTLEVFKKNATDQEYKICNTNLLERIRYIYLP